MSQKRKEIQARAAERKAAREKAAQERVRKQALGVMGVEAPDVDMMPRRVSRAGGVAGLLQASNTNTSKKSVVCAVDFLAVRTLKPRCLEIFGKLSEHEAFFQAYFGERREANSSLVQPMFSEALKQH